MLLILAIVIAVLWLGGWLIFPAIGALIHVLIVLAIILVLLHFFTGDRSRT